MTGVRSFDVKATTTRSRGYVDLGYSTFLDGAAYRQPANATIGAQLLVHVRPRGAHPAAAGRLSRFDPQSLSQWATSGYIGDSSQTRHPRRLRRV